jgi:hypothetical protein
MAALGTGIYKSKYVGAAIAPNKSTYFRIEPRVSWRITPYWTLDARLCVPAAEVRESSPTPQAPTSCM